MFISPSNTNNAYASLWRSQAHTSIGTPTSITGIERRTARKGETLSPEISPIGNIIRPSLGKKDGFLTKSELESLSERACRFIDFDFNELDVELKASTIQERRRFLESRGQKLGDEAVIGSIVLAAMFKRLEYSAYWQSLNPSNCVVATKDCERHGKIHQIFLLNIIPQKSIFSRPPSAYKLFPISSNTSLKNALREGETDPMGYKREDIEQACNIFMDAYTDSLDLIGNPKKSYLNYETTSPPGFIIVDSSSHPVMKATTPFGISVSLSLFENLLTAIIYRDEEQVKEDTEKITCAFLHEQGHHLNGHLSRDNGYRAALGVESDQTLIEGELAPWAITFLHPGGLGIVTKDKFGNVLYPLDLARQVSTGENAKYLKSVEAGIKIAHRKLCENEVVKEFNIEPQEATPEAIHATVSALFSFGYGKKELQKMIWEVVNTRSEDLIEYSNF